jgi:hypothetical protein
MNALAHDILLMDNEPSIAVLVPTLKRPDKLQPLLDNIHENTVVPHTVWFIAEGDDQPTLDALDALTGEHEQAIGKFGSCAKAMNAGYHVSDEPYVFTANDDLMFCEGWDYEALNALTERGKHVCGTNDSHGRMTCFTLVERSYIKRHSGVFDQWNTLYHPGYQSQYVDTEFADYAKARGVWTEAPDSCTRHLHHDFGDADPNHPNYIKARETLAADHATFEHRRPQWEKAARENQLCATP